MSCPHTPAIIIKLIKPCRKERSRIRLKSYKNDFLLEMLMLCTKYEMVDPNIDDKQAKICQIDTPDMLKFFVFSCNITFTLFCLGRCVKMSRYEYTSMQQFATQCDSRFAFEYMYFTVIPFVSNSPKFGVCTVMGHNGTLVLNL
jgi:hypothetical protein